MNAKIIHRDISIGNIVLNEAEDDAFLIDLDLDIKIDREKASGAPSKTGTKVFMAIGALYGEDHNFMHDLESFFGCSSGFARTGKGLVKRGAERNTSLGISSPLRNSRRSRTAW